MNGNFDESMLAFRANVMREGFHRSADAFAFEENQIALELAHEHEREQQTRRQRLANLGQEKSSCSNE